MTRTGDPSWHGATSHITFVPKYEDLAESTQDGLTVILDQGWVSGPETPGGVVSVSSAIANVLEERDLFRESLDLVNSWAARTEVAGLLLVEGVSYWYRLRESMWHWVHERLLWHYALAAMGASRTDVSFSIPSTELALIEVAQATGAPVNVVMPQAIAAEGRENLRSRAIRRLPPTLRRVYRWFRPHQDTLQQERQERKDRFLGGRVAQLAATEGRTVLVVSVPLAYQSVGAIELGVGEDPNLSPILPELIALGLEPIVIGLGMPRESDHFWPLVVRNERLLPSYYAHARWGRPSDEAVAQVGIDRALADLEPLQDVPFWLDGSNLTEPFFTALKSLAEGILRADLLELAYVERMVSELRPTAMLMTHEGHRTPWLIAGARAGIPTFAVQHGVLYDAHPGYPDHRDPRSILPTQTFVYGDFERRVLETCGYEPPEIAVSGSPRLDIEDDLLTRAGPEERARVRRRLGISDDRRLLVVSTGYLGVMRRHLTHMLSTLLGGPLPGVHVVFKQHPTEQDDGPYRALLRGLAESRGYDPPPISVVKDIDLYVLLRACDAHLGQHSTVLTDAVVAGTQNLIADVQRSAPLLDYVGAGVAWPVRELADVLDALSSPSTLDPKHRQAFLRDHFEPGHASGRIASAIANAVGLSGGQALRPR